MGKKNPKRKKSIHLQDRSHWNPVLQHHTGSSEPRQKSPSRDFYFPHNSQHPTTITSPAQNKSTNSAPRHLNSIPRSNQIQQWRKKNYVPWLHLVREECRRRKLRNRIPYPIQEPWVYPNGRRRKWIYGVAVGSGIGFGSESRSGI